MIILQLEEKYLFSSFGGLFWHFCWLAKKSGLLVVFSFRYLGHRPSFKPFTYCTLSLKCVLPKDLKLKLRKKKGKVSHQLSSLSMFLWFPELAFCYNMDLLPALFWSWVLEKFPPFVSFFCLKTSEITTEACQTVWGIF